MQRFTNVLAVQRLVWPNAAVVIARRTADFRGDNQLFAAALFRQPVANVGFGESTGFRSRRDRVHLGHVDQVNAIRDGIVELCMCIGFAILFTKRHCAQPQCTDFK